MSKINAAERPLRAISESDFEKDTNAEIKAFYKRSRAVEGDVLAEGLGLEYVYTAVSNSGFQSTSLKDDGGWLIAAGVDSSCRDLQDIALSYYGAGADLLEVTVSKHISFDETPPLDLPLLIRDRTGNLSELARDLGSSGQRLFGFLSNPLSPEFHAGPASATRISEFRSLFDYDVSRPCGIDVSVLMDDGLSIEHALVTVLVRIHACATALRKCTSNGFQLPDRTLIGWATGMSLFGEIAALRALRLLVPEIFRTWGYRAVCPHVHVVTSTAPLAGIGVNNNLIRTTIQSVAAILGGCDSLHVRRHDSTLKSGPGKLSSGLLALTTQHLMRHEAHLDKIADPTAGSYYVEHYTRKLARSAWGGFLEIVRSESVAVSFESDILPGWVEIDKIERAGRAAGRSEVVVGVNKYPSEMDNDHASAIVMGGIPWHTAAEIEAFRVRMLSLKLDGSHTPDCLLIPLSGSASCTRSVTFARNFLLCGGFSPEVGPQMENGGTNQLLNSTKSSSFVLFCGSAKDLDNLNRDLVRDNPSTGYSVSFGFASDEPLSDLPDNTVAVIPSIDPDTPLLQTLKRILALVNNGREDAPG